MTAISSWPMRYVFVPGPVIIPGFGHVRRRTRLLSTTGMPSVVTPGSAIGDVRRPAGPPWHRRPLRDRRQRGVVAGGVRHEDPHAAFGADDGGRDRRHVADRAGVGGQGRKARG